MHQIAKQWETDGNGGPFRDISSHSCLNSWTGGNIAARPLDTARFAHAGTRTQGGSNLGLALL